ncbi:MAG: glycoside hydrolase [Blastocatellia bacterium AA13]|nr:MAG: glycoside hydrolase [Blastocatellia bacterium AA13]
MGEPINVVIDVSHHNGEVDFQQAAAAGIVGVIHKATEGLTFEDPMYLSNRQKALDAGLLWGAYHFGTSDDGAAQADYFLQFVSPGPDTLLVLDYEPNSDSTMSLDQARAFVEEINAKIGRYPGLYSGSLIKETLGDNKDETLARCFLWLAEYSSTAIAPPNWPTWTLWQYTDGTDGPEPHSVTGIGDCDRDKFNGDIDGLKRLWGAAT